MPQNVDSLEEKPVNCIGCGKKIATGHMIRGRISVPCPRCKVINVIEARHKPEGHAHFLTEDPALQRKLAGVAR